MKELGYFGLLGFSKNAAGPFSFYNLFPTVHNRTTATWSAEDFGWVLFPACGSGEVKLTNSF